MKLRNKNTGEIVGLSIYGIEVHIRKENQPIYHSLAALNEEWEDYKPAEPLIKDEKIRKAVRAWAEANDDTSTTKLKFDEDNARFSTETSSIEFDRYPPLDRLEDYETYTIAELCGEGEE